MDKTCAFVEKVLQWAHRDDLPVIPYVGTSRSGFANAPAPYLEVCYVQSGGYEQVRLAQECFALPSNCVSIHSVHQGNYSPKNRRSKAWCLFMDVSSARELGDLQLTPAFFCVPVVHPDVLTRAFQRLTLRCRRFDWSAPVYPPPPSFLDAKRALLPQPVQRAAIKAALLDLLVVLHEEAQAQTSQAGGGMSRAIRAGMDFIELHHSDPDITLKDIAAAAHVTGDHFTRLFRANVGQPPMQYLRQIRIARSTSLLRDTDKRIEEIAWSVGFKDPLYFSRVFRQVRGQCPTEWRRLHAAT